VHGYYIEVSRVHSDTIPDHYQRRQTLKGAERYITPELKAFEDKVLSANERALAREKRIYEQLLEQIAEKLTELQRCAAALAELDALNNLAERAASLDWVAPSFTDRPEIRIIGGRHPVVEQLQESPFVPNDLLLDHQRRMLLITGPNMGGKSTYMRQTALIVLLAYMGSFVPAREALIGPVDRIFTRIGASDELASGRSTFMVEMTETANILHNATRDSLVLMDEIGRGTSTFDGLSLAWASALHLAREIGAFTLFATHYFELTRLPEMVPGVANVHLDAKEVDEHIVFLHSVKEGPASQSYGLQVAALAGVPREVILRARQKLGELERQRPSRQGGAGGTQPDLFTPPPPPSPIEQALICGTLPGFDIDREQTDGAPDTGIRQAGIRVVRGARRRAGSAARRPAAIKPFLLLRLRLFPSWGEVTGSQFRSYLDVFDVAKQRRIFTRRRFILQHHLDAVTLLRGKSQHLRHVVGTPRQDIPIVLDAEPSRLVVEHEAEDLFVRFMDAPKLAFYLSCRFDSSHYQTSLFFVLQPIALLMPVPYLPRR